MKSLKITKYSIKIIIELKYSTIISLKCKKKKKNEKMYIQNMLFVYTLGSGTIKDTVANIVMVFSRDRYINELN